MQFPTPSLLAVATGVVGSAWSSGMIASISVIGVPGALIASSSPATIWAEFFARGVALMPKVAATTAVGFLYAAYDTRQRGGNWKGFVAAGTLALAIVPYTLAFMAGTNNLLHGAVSGAGAFSEGEVKRLISKWGALNLGRSVLPLAGAGVGLVTLLQNVL
ncbi:hypothetical protein BGZ61DRAFT_208880 [Ilyonectria robusta]|uniref:uncharacterized protein n=1 Tax=Ilyonectria robusta TaxID=1079257 RepID=UPI001E8E77D7|nr:uncharacterized protein BGZ61DRAFT_208880 [Ilyonectria robusta]KAH8714264.1 hypothetical protein BGZ61DRAFT_208880 [Ilyonectria robusta]